MHINFINRIAAVVLFPIIFCACQTNAAHPTHQAPSDTPLESQNGLIGKIWDVKNGKFIDRQQLVKNVTASHYILLGETHDNLQHHKDHALLIQQIAAAQPHTAIGMEMVNSDQVSAIDKAKITSSNDLLAILENSNNNWDYRKYYSSVLDSIFNAKLSINAVDLDKPELMNILRGGFAHAPKQIQQLIQKNPLTDQERESLKQEIEATHCGMATENMTKAMMLGQQVRDANIALNLFKISSDGVPAVVLISGSGHIRLDRGVPMYLHSLDTANSSISVAWLEVNKEFPSPRDYAAQWSQSQLPFDFVVFTQQTERTDPCEEMKKFMHHMKKQKKSD